MSKSWEWSHSKFLNAFNWRFLDLSKTKTEKIKVLDQNSKLSLVGFLDLLKSF